MRNDHGNLILGLSLLGFAMVVVLFPKLIAITLFYLLPFSIVSLIGGGFLNLACLFNNEVNTYDYRRLSILTAILSLLAVILYVTYGTRPHAQDDLNRLYNAINKFFVMFVPFIRPNKYPYEAYSSSTLVTTVSVALVVGAPLVQWLMGKFGDGIVAMNHEEGAAERQIEALQNQTNALFREINSLENKNETLQSELEGKRKTIEDLKDQLQTYKQKATPQEDYQNHPLGSQKEEAHSLLKEKETQAPEAVEKEPWAMALS